IGFVISSGRTEDGRQQTTEDGRRQAADGRQKRNRIRLPSAPCLRFSAVCCLTRLVALEASTPSAPLQVLLAKYPHVMRQMSCRDVRQRANRERLPTRDPTFRPCVVRQAPE